MVHSCFLIFTLIIGIGIGLLASHKEEPKQILENIDKETALKIFISTFTISAETNRDVAKLLSTLSIAGLAASIASLQLSWEDSEKISLHFASIAFSFSFVSTIFPLAGLAEQYRSFSKESALSLNKKMELKISDLDPSLKSWRRLANFFAIFTVFAGILLLALAYWLHINNSYPFLPFV